MSCSRGSPLAAPAVSVTSKAGWLCGCGVGSVLKTHVTVRNAGGRDVPSRPLPPASRLPQLVEPVLWDYGADLDVHGKGQ